VSETSCPVCESALDFEPWPGGISSQEICPFCGIHFGYNDARPDLRQAVYAEWRGEWIAAGRRPITGAEWKRVATVVMRRVLASAQANS
jgi:hypothetical protein